MEDSLIERMPTSSLPTSGKLPTINSCLSSDCGSEENDAFPNALTLDAAHAPDQSRVPRSASMRAVELIRKSTGSLKPDRHESPVRDLNNADPGAAAAVAAAAPTEKADSKRTPVRPAEARSSVRNFSQQGRAISRKLSELLGLRGSRSGGPVQWKPHETILKALGHRPAGYGRPFADRYTLGGVLGTGGFGVVREGGHFLYESEICRWCMYNIFVITYRSLLSNVVSADYLVHALSCYSTKGNAHVRGSNPSGVNFTQISR